MILGGLMDSPLDDMYYMHGVWSRFNFNIQGYSSEKTKESRITPDTELDEQNQNKLGIL